MALDDREYISEKYRQRESIKQRNVDALRQRFEAATPQKPVRVTVPVPTSTVGMAAAAILFGCGITVVVLSAIVFIGQ